MAGRELLRFVQAGVQHFVYIAKVREMAAVLSAKTLIFAFEELEGSKFIRLTWPTFSETLLKYLLYTLDSIELCNSSFPNSL